MSKPPLELERKQKKPLPLEDKLICIDTSQGDFVYEYFNGVLNDIAARRFEEHLLLCFRCQDIILSLDAVFDVLAENPKPGIEASKKLCRQVMSSKMAKRNRF